VNRGRSVDGRNHRRLNFEQVHQQTFGVGQDVLSPSFGIDLTATEIFLVNEGFARARKDDDLVLGITADIAEAVTKLLMWQKTPDQVLVLGMERHLQDAVLTVELDVLILRRVLIEVGNQHVRFPFFAPIPARPVDPNGFPRQGLSRFGPKNFQRAGRRLFSAGTATNSRYKGLAMLSCGGAVTEVRAKHARSTRFHVI
jgi:hypothetical protein